jgi:hypothetical protein
MIEVFKILAGKYNRNVRPVLPLSLNTRITGNFLKLNTGRAKQDLRKFSFQVELLAYGTLYQITL